jgi:hypothetical protein
MSGNRKKGRQGGALSCLALYFVLSSFSFISCLEGNLSLPAIAVTPIIVKVMIGNQSVSVRGRAAIMIGYLVRMQDRINDSIGQGEISFNVAGCKVRPRLVTYDEEIEVPKT